MNKKKPMAAAIIGALVVFLVICVIARETGYHFYLANGMTVTETTARYGKPLWTDGSSKENDLRLFYYSGILNTVELKSDHGRIVEVNIYSED